MIVSLDMLRLLVFGTEEIEGTDRWTRGVLNEE